MTFFNSQQIGEIQLIASVAFFGLSFMLCRYAAITSENNLGPVTFNACRYVVSSILMGFILPMMNKFENQGNLEIVEKRNQGGSLKDTLYYGCLSGFCGFFASTLQQIGLIYISTAKSAFITSLYVILVPIFESITTGYIFHSTWAAALFSIIGTYLVSGLAEGESIAHGMGYGEGLTLLCMLFWCGSLLFSDRGCKTCDCVAITTVDFIFTTLLALIASIFFEPSEWAYPYTNIRSNLWIIFLTGITECGAFLFCSFGQMTVDPSRTALILSMESLSGGICGYLFLNEVLSPIELVGCLVMSLAFLISSSEWDLTDLFGGQNEQMVVTEPFRYDIIGTEFLDIVPQASDTVHIEANDDRIPAFPSYQHGKPEWNPGFHEKKDENGVLLRASLLKPKRRTNSFDSDLFEAVDHSNV